jgi:NAD(P) transhydrogenase
MNAVTAAKETASKVKSTAKKITKRASRAKYDYDMIVIGSGPGGEGAAMQGAKSGKRVALIEAMPVVGGHCTHYGTIPSKAIRHTIERVMEAQNNPLIRKRQTSSAQVSLSDIMSSCRSIIDDQVSTRRQFYMRNHVDVIHGYASFIGKHKVSIARKDREPLVVTAANFVLAMGSSPFRPPNIDFDHPCVVDSDTLLDVEDLPHTLTVFGAGVIGCEYASMFGTLGIKVNLINSQSRLLSFVEEEIGDALTYHLRNQGVVIRHNEEFESVTTKKTGVVLNLKSGKKVKSQMLLWAAGRSGNTKNMGLEAIGIEPNRRGNIEINEQYQSSLPHIYAVGDITGYPGLASAAYDQGRFAALHIIEGNCDLSLINDIPSGIYTIPEISSVGRTEQELTEAKVAYEVGHADFKHLARAQMTQQTAGMLKILFDTKTRKVLGIHCFGDRAGEIVHIGQAVMLLGGTIDYFVNTTFNYPTMAEAYRVAALAGINRLVD